MLAKLQVFGVLLLTSSVLSENDNIDSIYKAIKDITGYDRSDIMKINEYIDAVQHGKQGKLDSHLLKKDRDFQKALNPLPLDASRFILSKAGAGSNLSSEARFRKNHALNF
ncbi:hypothetical protein V3C99_001086 [Haemonchus contortus]